MNNSKDDIHPKGEDNTEERFPHKSTVLRPTIEEAEQSRKEWIINEAKSSLAEFFPFLDETSAMLIVTAISNNRIKHIRMVD